MSKMNLWLRGADLLPSSDLPLPLSGLMAFSGSAITAVSDPDAVSAGSGIYLLPAPRSHDSALALLPAGVSPAPLQNGVPLPPGLHLLHHGDRLDLGEGSLWISWAGEPERTNYDPPVHGEDVFCFRTKARLEPGEPIVICPGLPSAPCGAIYKESAWEVGLKCHNCGFDPSRPPWRPPLPASRNHLDEFLKLAGSQHA